MATRSLVASSDVQNGSDRNPGMNIKEGEGPVYTREGPRTMAAMLFGLSLVFVQQATPQDWRKSPAL